MKVGDVRATRIFSPKGKTHPSCTTEKMNREEEEEEVCGAYASRCFQASREEETIQPGHKLFRRTSR